LASSHIFVYTPQPNEGTLDLVILEAMASGLPCVLSNVPCANEAVEDGVTGLLTPFGDGQAFAESAIRLVRDQDLAQALGQRAADVAREGFDIRQRLPLYQAAYERALSERLLPRQLRFWKERFVHI
jgi:glycosyltransferase involved in cell wall biosynthesis